MSEIIPLLCVLIFMIFLDYRVEKKIKCLEEDINIIKKIQNENNV